MGSFWFNYFIARNISSIKDYRGTSRNVVLKDINGDGSPDIITYNKHRISNLNDFYSIYCSYNDGKGNFSEVVTLLSTSNLQSLGGLSAKIYGFDDIDGDGLIDIFLQKFSNYYGSSSNEETRVVQKSMQMVSLTFKDLQTIQEISKNI